MTTDDNDRIRAAWRSFTDLNEELLELALADGELDDGSAATLLARLVGHIQYSGLLLNSDPPARPTLINTQYSPWNWGGHSNPDTLYLSARIDDAHDYRVSGTLGSVAQTTFGVYTGKDDQAPQSRSSPRILPSPRTARSKSFFLAENRGAPTGSSYRPGPTRSVPTRPTAIGTVSARAPFASNA